MAKRLIAIWGLCTLLAIALAVPMRDNRFEFAEQIHVAIGDADDQYVVSFVSNSASSLEIHYGMHRLPLTHTAKGDVVQYQQGGYTSGFIHHITLTGIKPSSNVYFQVRFANQHSEVLSFKSVPAVGPASRTVLSIIGDLGQTSDSYRTVMHTLDDKDHHATIIAGDLSYADGYQPRWDSWGKMMQPLASAWPLMVAPGNHEIEHDDESGREFVAYQHRFRMPSASSGSEAGNLWYSFDIGSAHIIMLSSYSDFHKGSEQFAWLGKDLLSVDRSVTPWLIVVLHAPWYNSNTAHHNEGEEVQMKEAMEPMLFKAGVNFVFAGHVHAYERCFATYGNSTNPRGPTYINIGDGGNREGIAAAYLEPAPVWSAVRGPAFGHGKLDLVNSTHAQWTWHKNDMPEWKVADDLWVVRSQ